MMPKPEALTFKRREFKGSRLRCLLATHQPREKVAAFLTDLACGAAAVTPLDTWAPDGFLQPSEAKLDEPNGFLDAERRETLASWWLAIRGNANTPNWDIVSTARISGELGLLLVEGKAHAGEFRNDRCGATNLENFRQICGALADATAGWNALQPGFALSADQYFQLSNRFAFAWKLASMRIPVVLVYLGFLHAVEMQKYRLLPDAKTWRVIPAAAWNRRFEVGHEQTPLYVMVNSAEVTVDATVAVDGAS